MNTSTFTGTSRPALLEKPANVILSPSKQSQKSLDTMNKPLKLTAPTISTVSAAPIISPAAIAGQKRSIDQVDADHDPIDSVNSSFGQAKQEDEFYIFEEPSQSSLDIDKEASFLRYSALPESGHDHLNQESQESIGLTSLLNLSQASDKYFPTTLCSTSKQRRKEPVDATSIVPSDPEQRKLFIEQKANLLRIRLQAAVRVMDQKKDFNHRLADYEARDEAQRKQWGNTVDQLNSNPNLMAQGAEVTPQRKAPRLDPSPPLQDRGRVANIISPPSASNTNGIQNHNATPTQYSTDQNQQTSHELLSSIRLLSPGSGDRNDPIVVDRDINCSVEQMIAKTKRGEALDGLLKLMETTTEYDALDEWTG
ncbi:hypothetical protein LOZ53_005792 [Ophidiomyces ophidiicola]|nr:hypothetical protein LOZ53_005792 [Ophidiomyces ophidiicola]